LLLQIRTRVLNGEWEATFHQWYPGFRAHTTPVAARGCPPRTTLTVPRLQTLGPPQPDSTIPNGCLTTVSLVRSFTDAATMHPTEQVYCRTHGTRQRHGYTA